MSSKSTFDAGGISLKADLWLSEMLGCPAFGVVASTDGDDIGLLNDTYPAFAYAKFPVTDVASVMRLTSLGFRVVDVALNFQGAIAPDTDNRIRFAEAADKNAVSTIAENAFSLSRFHLDPAIPNPVADKIKSVWASNFFSKKRGDGMVVAACNNRIVGFLQLIWTTNGNLSIDLIGIHPQWRRQGIGGAMIKYAAQNGTDGSRRPLSLSVGTQVANLPSVRLYESLGFRLASSQYVMHYHAAKEKYI